jgi:MFS family permease
MSEKKPAQYPNQTYGWYVVCILTLAYVFSFLDRQILALLIEPIRKDMDISDTQISLLLGLAFSIFYTLLGVPIGRLADRKSRRGIIAIGITIWCIMTAACGLAKTFTQLFLARVGVGVGEASLNPSALSLISDYFPREKRARPIGFYNMGVSLGAGVAMVIGGQIIAWVFDAPTIEIPVFGELKPWQAVFVMVGLPGLLIALLMATVKEPARQDELLDDSGQAEVLPLKTVLRFLLDRKSTYLSLFLGMSVVTIVGYGFLFWIPTMFIRTWGWSIAEVSMAYGSIGLVFGPIGVNFGGWLAQKLYSDGRRAGHMRVTILGAFILVPSATLAPLMPTPELTLLMLVFVTIGGAMPSATAAAALMMIVPNQMRGQTTAMYYFVTNVLGLTMGSTAIALVTDYVFKDDLALRYSIAWVSGTTGVVAIALLLYNLAHYRKSVIEADSWCSESID